MRLAFCIACLALPLLGGCAATPDEKTAAYPSLTATAYAPVTGAFAAAPGVDAFVQRMRRHGFAPSQTAAILSRAQRQQSIIDLMDRQAPSKSSGPNGAWTRYRAKFLSEESIANGASFWRRHAGALERATQQYGVPPQYVVAIIGVETRYGGYLGQTRIIDALATLAFAYPRRADYFADELENYLLMTRDEGLDPFQPRGSFAGAMGLGQFMPSSFRDYAVDHNGDRHRNLWDPDDAIGSVANYFKGHGWRRGEPVVVRASLANAAAARALKTGFATYYAPRDLERRGIRALGSLAGADQVSLLELDARGGYEYWIGLPNFFVITRYNHSTYYAMAVHQLAEAIRSRMGRGSGARFTAAD